MPGTTSRAARTATAAPAHEPTLAELRAYGWIVHDRPMTQDEHRLHAILHMFLKAPRDAFLRVTRDDIFRVIETRYRNQLEQEWLSYAATHGLTGDTNNE